jgi:transposase-like protein
VLKAWLRQFDQDPDNPFPGKGGMRAEEAELFRLKRELMKVTAERDILKMYGLPPESKVFRRFQSQVVSRQCIRPTDGAFAPGLDGTRAYRSS